MIKRAIRRRVYSEDERIQNPNKEFGEKISCIIPVSATGRKGLRELLDVLKKALPHRQKIFPKGAVSDRDESFLAAEFIREKIFRLTRGELPYGTTVVVNEFQRRKKGAIFVRADVILEREGQKKIVLGKEIFPKIGFYARRDIENLTGSRVFLELNVRVKKGWSEDPEFLNELYERN